MITCPDVRIGQGHNDRNNWWIGGENCLGENSARKPVTCTCNDGASITFSPGHINRFSVVLNNKCGIIQMRSGEWVPVTAAADQTVGFKFTSSSTDYTETDFMN